MVKVYFANIELINEPEIFSSWFECMNRIRKEKILRYKQEVDKKRSLLAGILLKLALEREGFCYEKLEFDLEAHGRPIIKHADNIYFSLSHAGSYALCCISDHQVGADMEGTEKAIFKEEKAERMSVMAKKILSEIEYERFQKCDVKEKVSLFLKYWTCKESYSKAIGEGLRMEFSKIDTVLMEEAFWSDWLEEDCFVSIYTEQEREIEFVKITDLKS